MKLSFDLLKQFVKINVSPQKLGGLLTEHSFEVEEVTSAGANFEGIVAAKVLSIQKHPNADRLRLIKLDSGSQIVEPVVCGAFNFFEGAMVALALPGAKIAQNIHSLDHEPFVLEKATIRGVESQGMICAEFELGLAKDPGDKPEIMLLDASVKPGTLLSKVLNQETGDYIINAALPANRSDLHSHLGVAREIAAVLNQKVLEPKAKKTNLKPSKKWKIVVKDTTHCPRYYGVRMKVKVGPSPKFIANLLSGVGMRPINNVVDITNFVMLELGNPTHAFDANFVEGGIIVKNAQKGEKFMALNHKEYILDDEVLMIADEKKNLAIGAIIGGKESRVISSTEEIILEVANFEPVGIRRTSKKLGIRTEGSAMWEKGVHPKLSEVALARALELLKKYASAEILEFAEATTTVKEPASIKFSADDINKLLGTNLKASVIVKYLSRYQITTKILNPKSKILNSTPPWWRRDITSMPDLAEEVLKLFGYNNVKPQALSVIPTDSPETGLTLFMNNTKEFWARMGFTEAQNYNFVSERDIKSFKENPAVYVKVENPLSSGQGYLKRNMLIPLVKNVESNQKHFDEFKIMELGKEYYGFENEQFKLGAIYFSKSQSVQKLVAKFKGNIVEYLAYLGWQEVAFNPQGKTMAEIKVGGDVVGNLGIIPKSTGKYFNVDYDLVFLKLDFEKVYKFKKDITFKPLSRFPTISRDISVIVGKDVLWEGLEKAIRETAQFLVKVDAVQADYLAEGKSNQQFHEQLAKKGLKNMGIRLVFQAENRTLTEAEIAGILDQIVLKLREALNAEIR